MSCNDDLSTLNDVKFIDLNHDAGVTFGNAHIGMMVPEPSCRYGKKLLITQHGTARVLQQYRVSDIIA